MTKEKMALGMYHSLKENYGKNHADDMACSIAINVYKHMGLEVSDIQYLYDLMLNQ